MNNDELLSIAEVCKKLKISRAKLNNMIEKKEFTLTYNEKGVKRLYSKEIFKYLENHDVDAPKEVDPRNKLNNLNGTEWIPCTKSFMYQKGLGSNHKDAQIEKLHPAPYSFQDIQQLILFFTKEKGKVLDPFGGVGSTAKACELTNRICTSIELSPKWHELSLQRLEKEIGKGTSKKHNFINGDSVEELKKIKDFTFDFVVTSPPYWSILNKKVDHKTIARVEENLDTNYSNLSKDLGNIENYYEFLEILVNEIFKECGRVLKNDKYMAIVVSDFRNKSEFISFHSDLIQKINKLEVDNTHILTLQGVKVLLQNHKSLLPYGYPFAYVENIHHQYILIFKKSVRKAR